MGSLTPKTDGPREIHPTREELDRGQFGSANLQKALEAFNQDGFVVLKSVVDVEHVEHINDYMKAATDGIIQERHADAKAYNQGVKCA